MALYVLTCSGTAHGPADVVLGVLELPDDNAAPDQAAWGMLCDTCTAAWHQTIANAHAAAAAGNPGPPASVQIPHPQQLAPLGPPRPPKPAQAANVDAASTAARPTSGAGAA